MLKSQFMRVLCALTLAFAMFMLPACTSSESPSNDVAAEQEQNEINVQVTVDTMAIDSAVMYDEMQTLPIGANAYDALVATGLPVVSSESPYGGEYVSSIGGLSEKQFGDMSGWTYTVNGEYVTTSASETVLNDGDTLVWSYFTGE